MNYTYDEKSGQWLIMIDDIIIDFVYTEEEAIERMDNYGN